jgi:ATP-dependent Clp protease adaptor protein ClpS
MGVVGKSSFSLWQVSIMAEESNDAPKAPADSSSGGSSATATAKPKRSPKNKPPGLLPPWKVLLHNDDKNTAEFVVSSITELTPLKKPDALLRMKEAHETGVALLLVTHKERAELYKDQFESKGMTVTIEPTEAE